MYPNIDIHQNFMPKSNSRKRFMLGVFSIESMGGGGKEVGEGGRWGREAFGGGVC